MGEAEKEQEEESIETVYRQHNFPSFTCWAVLASYIYTSFFIEREKRDDKQTREEFLYL